MASFIVCTVHKIFPIQSDNISRMRWGIIRGLKNERRVLVGKFEERRPLVRYRREWEDSRIVVLKKQLINLWIGLN
jgi:hypothetical protein